jgi:hypothetical protein
VPLKFSTSPRPLSAEEGPDASLHVEHLPPDRPLVPRKRALLAS